jgi:hypothetical protein
MLETRFLLTASSTRSMACIWVLPLNRLQSVIKSLVANS